MCCTCMSCESGFSEGEFNKGEETDGVRSLGADRLTLSVWLKKIEGQRRREEKFLRCVRIKPYSLL